MGLFGGKKAKDDRDNARLIARLDGQAVKYVARRDPESSTETVIGKAGRINTKNGLIAIVCNGSEVYRCDAAAAKCGELMSLNGVVIETPDGAGGRSIVVAYYQYYRKVND